MRRFFPSFSTATTVVGHPVLRRQLRAHTVAAALSSNEKPLSMHGGQLVTGTPKPDWSVARALGVACGVACSFLTTTDAFAMDSPPVVQRRKSQRTSEDSRAASAGVDASSEETPETNIKAINLEKAHVAACSFWGAKFKKISAAAAAYNIRPQQVTYQLKKVKESVTQSVAKEIARLSPWTALIDNHAPQVPVVKPDLNAGVIDVMPLQGGDSTRLNQYGKAYIIVGDLLRQGGPSKLGTTEAIAEGFRQTGYRLSRGAAANAKADTPGVVPRAAGRPSKYPVAAEEQLVKVILKLRTMKLDTSRQTVMIAAARMLIGTPEAAEFMNKVTGNIRIDKSFYDSLCRKYPGDIRIAQARTTEAPRVKWGKSRYYKTVRKSIHF